MGARKRDCNRFKCSVVRRRRRPWLIASAARDSSRSTEGRCTSSSQGPSGRNSKSPCCSSARTDSPRSISESGSTEVVTSPKFMLFVRPFPSLWWLIIRSTSTRPPRRRSRTFSSPTTAPSSLPTLGGTSPRSSVVQEPERVTRNLTVKAEKTLSQFHPRRKEEHFSHTHTLATVYSSHLRPAIHPSIVISSFSLLPYQFSIFRVRVFLFFLPSFLKGILLFISPSFFPQ